MNIRFSDQEFYYDENSIFLAGPTLRDNVFANSWRSEACDILKNMGFNGTVYIPEFSIPRHFDDSDLDNQVEWEWDCLDTAGVIAFWVPRELELLPGFTTNVEFGRYITKKPNQVILGYPENAEKIEYLKRLYLNEIAKEPARTLEETLKKSVDLLLFNRKSLI
jgi:hypothetical protein